MGVSDSTLNLVCLLKPKDKSGHCVRLLGEVNELQYFLDTRIV